MSQLAIEFDRMQKCEIPQSKYWISIEVDLLRFPLVTTESQLEGRPSKVCIRSFNQMSAALQFSNSACRRRLSMGYIAKRPKQQNSFLREFADFKQNVDKSSEDMVLLDRNLRELLNILFFSVNYKDRISAQYDCDSMKLRQHLNTAAENVVNLAPNRLNVFLNKPIHVYFSKEEELANLIWRLHDLKIFFVGDFVHMTKSEFRNFSEASDAELESVQKRLHLSGLDFNFRNPRWARPYAPLYKFV